ncbi:GNAT family N-acetyltransferase [Aureispira anguillae]|uniref:GNAT family N-acetyltransferase n=1 Tax=Aureispira anguillae TaxID=2864201 RepID=A0A916DNP0_9BACT|nr:GNAT family N-acetyltransferase [Aureispira anguillae]BDS10014.1 GNAT family N-acetyltransferase [Aureispira anguillae]
MQQLNTIRTIIRPLSVTDFEEIVAMYLEPNSNAFIPPLQNKTEEEYLAFLHQKVAANRHSQGLGFWTVRSIEDERFLGTANLNTMEVLNIVHIGAHLKRSAWGLGYATEVLSVLKEYGFQTLNLSKIYGIVSPDHSASKNMLQKIGLNYESTTTLGGAPIDLFSIVQ